MSTEDKKTLTPQILALYLGCEMQWEIEGAQPASAKLQIVNLDGFVTLNLHGQRIGKLGSELKPILRPLSSITDEDRKQLWRLVFSAGNKMNELGLNYRGTTRFIDKKTTDAEPRWVMSQGLELLGIEMNGTVWADCDLHRWKHNQHEVTLWLLSKGFDLFGLIDSGLAITQPK